ncbi:MAG TPA: hypothetical protein VN426_02130 [Syntrophomonadaceae bacterium]|nr:hypothetical protein [Syntrophomonadaceae bacterium]
MFNEQQVVQSCISHINSAKQDIENLTKNIANSKSREEFDLAYHALNDTISHCNSAMKMLG